MDVNIYRQKPQTHAFSQPCMANKNSCQPLAALENLKQVANRKVYIWPP